MQVETFKEPTILIKYERYVSMGPELAKPYGGKLSIFYNTQF
jgi:hypothetical protein